LKAGTVPKSGFEVNLLLKKSGFVPIMDGRFDKKIRRKYNEVKISFPIKQIHG
jgi:hypothetical protein